MDRFTRSGLEFEVRDGGPPDGEVVILLHGFPQTASAWSDVEPLLHQLGLRTLAPNQRGYSPGARPPGRRSYTISEAAADALALMDAAGASQAHVVGHDWGGTVAWWLGANAADRVRSLTVLSTPHPRAMARSMLRSLQPVRSSYVALFQLPVLPERLLAPQPDGSGRLRDQLVASGLEPDRAASYTRALSEPGALAAALNWYRAIPFERPDRAPGSIPLPTRYLWGSKDGALGRTAAQLTARYVEGDYRFVPLEGARHWLPEMRPNEVAAAVGELTGR